MYRAQIYLLVTLLVSTTLIEAAEDYVVPAGVPVLTEDQLLNQIIGSTLMGGNFGWMGYFLPPSGDQKKGRLKGKNAVVGPMSGDWTVNGSLMCWHFDSARRASYNGCFTTALDGDTVTWYLPTGTPRYSRTGRIKLISGNPENY
jgi:hypothetical protein